MVLPDPPSILYEIWNVSLIKIEKHKDYEDGRLRVQQKGGLTFCGMLVKDLYRTQSWHKILPKLKPLYLAFHGGSCPLQIDVWYQEQWHTIWDRSNDFESFVEEKKSTDRYENFVIKEGKKVKKLIDEGKTFTQIRKLMSNEHSGNTYGYAMNMGIGNAKNRENAEKVRIAHNKEYGIKDPKKKGVVNPAILTIG